MERSNANDYYKDEGLFGTYYPLEDFKRFVEEEKAKGLTEQCIYHKMFNGWKNAASACDINAETIDNIKNKKHNNYTDDFKDEVLSVFITIDNIVKARPVGVKKQSHDMTRKMVMSWVEKEIPTVKTLLSWVKEANSVFKATAPTKADLLDYFGESLVEFYHENPYGVGNVDNVDNVEENNLSQKKNTNNDNMY